MKIKCLLLSLVLILLLASLALAYPRAPISNAPTGQHKRPIGPAPIERIAD